MYPMGAEGLYLVVDETVSNHHFIILKSLILMIHVVICSFLRVNSERIISRQLCHVYEKLVSACMIKEKEKV